MATAVFIGKELDGVGADVAAITLRSLQSYWPVHARYAIDDYLADADFKWDAFPLLDDGGVS